jgi:hypothetical protein
MRASGPGSCDQKDMAITKEAGNPTCGTGLFADDLFTSELAWQTGHSHLSRLRACPGRRRREGVRPGDVRQAERAPAVCRRE